MLNKHDYFERRTRAILRERRDLWRRPPIIHQLAEPIQAGWRRFYALTPLAEQRGDRETLAAILKVIGSEQFCRRRYFRTRPSRKRKGVELEQPLERIFDHRWEQLHRPALWQPYFRWVHYSEWGRPRYFGEFRRPWLFELHVEPHFVWQVVDVDPDVETRLSEIRSWLTHTRAADRCAKRKWKSWWHRLGVPEPRAKARADEDQRRIRAAMLDPSEADSATPVWRRRISLRDSSLAQTAKRQRPGRWNVNRTSVPGRFAKAIERLRRLGCKSSAFRHSFRPQWRRTAICKTTSMRYPGPPSCLRIRPN